MTDQILSPVKRACHDRSLWWPDVWPIKYSALWGLDIWPVTALNSLCHCRYVRPTKWWS